MQMGEILSKLNGGELLGLCGIMLGLIATLGGIGVALTKVIATYYRRVQLDEMEATLKLEMIQRGMSAEDITRVLDAKTGSSRGVSMADLLIHGGLPQLPHPFGRQANKS
jgi:hypothetical protein